VKAKATAETHSDTAQMNAILARQKAAHLRDGAPSLEKRIDWLNRCIGLLVDYSDEIEQALNADFGARSIEATRFTDVAGSIGPLKFARANVAKWMKTQKRKTTPAILALFGAKAEVQFQPKGVVGIISPWNFPVNLMCKKMAAALAAGCSIIAKPPEETPASTSAIMQCVIDGGVPGNVAQLVYGVPDMVSRHLIASPIIRKVSFTGSVPVGKHLLKLAAERVKRTTMELGGHAPVLIFDDCDLEKAITLSATTKFRNAGQVCISPTRFYVQESVYDRFVAGFAELTKKVQVGNGLDASTVMGPLANERRPSAIAALVDDATSKGAKLLTGGSRGDQGFFFAPTVLSDVPMSAKVMDDEPFGPVALMRPFKTFDEAVAQANRLPFGLAAYAFTENARQANLVADALDTGMVGLNSFVISMPDAPFGGVKESGFGSEGGPEGLDSYYVTKAVHQY